MSTRTIKQRFVEQFPIDELEEWPGNPRVHPLEDIRNSVESYGFVGGIVVHEPTRRIIAGHGRVTVLRLKGAKTVPAFLVDCDEETAQRLLLSLNQIEDHSSWDNARLAEFIQQLAADDMSSLAQLEIPGFQKEELEKLDKLVGEAIDLAVRELDIETIGICPTCKRPYDE